MHWRVSTLTAHYTPSPLRTSLTLLAWIIIILAFVASAVLLVSDVLHMPLAHAPISAAPLLFIGAASLVFQVYTRPKPLDLLKSLIVSAAFILWGIDQLLPSGWGQVTLGDMVITLYVIDLGWMMLERLRIAKS
jgi:hypothetical protein